MNSNKTIRLRTTPGESQNIQFKIEQEFDTLDILSLKITQEEVYRNFCSDYGVVVGRIIANDGFGVENAKLSVFIPISNEDQENTRLSSVYPYTTVNDTDAQGIRYNLLPKQGKKYTHYQTFPSGVNPNSDPYNYQSPFKGNWTSSSWVLETNNPDGTTVYSREAELSYGPDVSVGTFPSKQEFLDNDILLEVYEKYYKLTTKTNTSGDYMLFGVPVGNQTIHMDVDLSDAGDISLTVEDFIDAGFPQQLFDVPNKKFLSSTNLDSLPQIESRNISVEVVPFWGDLDQCEIGITRLDFNLNKTISPSSILIFQAFTNSDPDLAINKGDCNIDSGNENEFTSIGNMSKLGVKVITTAVNTDFTKTENFNEGNVFITLPMYEDRYITDEFGNYVLSPDQNKGVPTGGRYYFTIYPINDYVSYDQLYSSNQGKGYACYQTNSTSNRSFYATYDLKNKKRKIYTFGNSNDSLEDDSRVTSISNHIPGNNITYPVNFKPDDVKRFMRNINTGENGVCYGSLYFPRLEWKGDEESPVFCDDVAVIQTNRIPNGLEYGRLKINNTNFNQPPYYMDITDVIKLFKEFGGGIQMPTSAFLGLYTSSTDIATTPTGGSMQSNGINISDQTIPLKNSISGFQPVSPPLNLNTDSTPWNNIVRTNSFSILPLGGPYGQQYSNSGRYFFYFGLKDDDNALTYLKERL
jgi:hypothetical protein